MSGSSVSKHTLALMPTAAAKAAAARARWAARRSSIGGGVHSPARHRARPPAQAPMLIISPSPTMVRGWGDMASIQSHHKARSVVGTSGPYPDHGIGMMAASVSPPPLSRRRPRLPPPPLFTTHLARSRRRLGLLSTVTRGSSLSIVCRGSRLISNSSEVP